MRLMKKNCIYIVLLIFTLGNSFGQTTKKISVYSIDDKSTEQSAGKVTSELFKNNLVPEKWKNESAVVLAQEIRYEFGNYNSPKYRVKVHKKIKLQDQNAISNFSRFYSSDKENLEVTIIKNNGKEIVVDANNAISVNEAPQYFEDYIETNSYYKLAIPGLEIGDIIDFKYQSSKWDLKIEKTQHFGFPLINIQFMGKYPIMEQKYIFESNREDHVTTRFTHFKVPIVLTKTETGNDLYIYELTVKDQDKYVEKRWEFEDLIIPSLKVQCVYSPVNSTKDVYRYFPRFKDGVLKDSINNEEWQYYLRKYIETTYPIVPIWSNRIQAENKIKSEDNDEIAMHYYYAFRDFYFTQKDITTNKEQLINDELFVKVFRLLLERKGIPYTIGIVFPKSIGDEKVVTSFNEGSLFIEVNNVSYYPFDYCSLAGEIPFWYENSTAFSFDIVDGKFTTFKKRITSCSKYTENVTSFVKNVTVDLTKKTLKIQELTNEIGDEKSSNFQNLILNESYFDKRGKANINSITPIIGKTKSIQELHNQKAKQAKQELILKCQLEYLKDSKEDDDDVFLVSYDSLKVFKTGRLANNPSLNFEEQYVVSKEIHEIGNDIYSLSIGKLIGNQIALDQDEITRTVPAYFGYAKNFKYEINLSIPSGYKIVGLEGLNVEIDNVICKYSSSVKEENNKVIWKIEKSYKKTVVDAKDWVLLQKMLDRAFDNTQKKVILKKI